MIEDKVIIRLLKQQSYSTTLKAMQNFTQTRLPDTLDEIWLLEHDSVFTQGQNGKKEHILEQGNIPIIQTDRGGQVTYHGPGQQIIYVLVDLKRKKLTIREFIISLEQAIINLLAQYNIAAIGKRHAPGVYVRNKKICSVGLRIKKGCSYHGLALNVAMNLTPFTQINPCGFKALKMTQLQEWFPNVRLESLTERIIYHFMQQLRYTSKHCQMGFI